MIHRPTDSLRNAAENFCVRKDSAQFGRTFARSMVLLVSILFTLLLLPYPTYPPPLQSKHVSLHTNAKQIAFQNFHRRLLVMVLKMVSVFSDFSKTNPEILASHVFTYIHGCRPQRFAEVWESYVSQTPPPH